MTFSLLKKKLYITCRKIIWSVQSRCSLTFFILTCLKPNLYLYNTSQQLCTRSTHCCVLMCSIQVNRPIAQIPQCTCPISHNTPICNKNVRMGCAHFCYKMVHCGIWDWCIVWFVRWLNFIPILHGYIIGTLANISVLQPWRIWVRKSHEPANKS